MMRPLISMCVISPPLVIAREQIDDMVAILNEGISRTMDDLRKEASWQAASPGVSTGSVYTNRRNHG